MYKNRIKNKIQITSREKFVIPEIAHSSTETGLKGFVSKVNIDLTSIYKKLVGFLIK